MFALLVTPVFTDFCSAFTNKIIVGIDFTFSLVGKFGSSSILCFATTTLVISLEISSRIGERLKHGVHHVAHPSQSTILFFLIIDSKVLSVDFIVGTVLICIFKIQIIQANFLLLFTTKRKHLSSLFMKNSKLNE